MLFAYPTTYIHTRSGRWPWHELVLMKQVHACVFILTRFGTVNRHSRIVALNLENTKGANGSQLFLPRPISDKSDRRTDGRR